MRNLLDAIKSANVVEGINAGGETSVKAENLVVDEGGKRKVVEKVGEVLPNILIAILSQALIVEAIDLGDLTRLVVPSEDGDSAWVSNFECNKERDRFHRVISSINVVTYSND